MTSGSGTTKSEAPDAPLVCVVMPARGSASTLRAAVVSALSQGYKRVVVVIVVDEGDEETELAARGIPDDRVIVLEQPGQGIGAARNFAIKTIEADLYMFLDSDDTFEDEVITRYVQEWSRTPSVALLYADWTGIDPMTRRRRQRKRWQPRNTFAGLLLDNFIATGTVMITKSALEATRGFDESYHHAEDWDFWLRIARSWDIRHLPISALRYSESKLERVYPRAFFRDEIEIISHHAQSSTTRLVAIGLAHGRHGLYYLRTFRRRTRREQRDVLLRDFVWILPLLIVRAHREFRARVASSRLAPKLARHR